MTNYSFNGLISFISSCLPIGYRILKVSFVSSEPKWMKRENKNMLSFNVQNPSVMPLVWAGYGSELVQSLSSC